eukprot:gene7077-8729_t
MAVNFALKAQGRTGRDAYLTNPHHNRSRGRNPSGDSRCRIAENNGNPDHCPHMPIRFCNPIS